MKNIFQMGSCRTVRVNRFCESIEYSFHMNYDLMHTTKEALMYIDIYNGAKNIKDIDNIECLFNHPENFNLEKQKKAFDDADAITIEISSLKIFTYKNNGNFYQAERIRQNNRKEFTCYNQTEEEFKEDILTIQNKIKKPTIFIGHIDFDFPNIGYISTRKVLDEWISKYCDNYILMKKVFEKFKYEDVFTEELRVNDTNHISKLGYELVSEAILNKIKKIINNE